MEHNDKKILFTISTLTGGGAERVVTVWANDLSERGYHVAVLICGRTENEYPLNDTVTVISTAESYELYSKIPTYRKFLMKRKAIKQFAPDYIISFLSQNRMWTYLCTFGMRVKKIDTVRNSPWHTDIPQKGISGFITKRSFHKCYKLILQSSDQAPYFSDKIKKKCVIIPNPISEVYKTSFKTEFSDQVKTFIAVGRLTEQKNYPMMIKAFAQALSKMEEPDKPILKIFGSEDSPNYAEKMQLLIREEGLEKYVLLMGRSSSIETEYRIADAFLMSSNFEGMPNALAEAMASGLVCVSTDCKTGPRDLISNGENGYLIPVGNIEAMAAQILFVSKLSRMKRINIGSNARKKIMSFCSEKTTISKLCEIL